MSAKDIAKTLVSERLSAGSFKKYPHDIPQTMSAAYEIQDAAIAMWPSKIIGWKIGRLAPDLQPIHNTERLTGPIFENEFKKVNDVSNEITVEIPVYSEGFAALEAEFVFEIAKDADINKTDYSENSAVELIGAVYAGIEMAGSPIQNINGFGPCVVASDFGNNFGLILGNKIIDINSADDLSADAVNNFQSESFINGQSVGQGGLFTMPNGPLAAVAWLANTLAARGLPLKKGQLISSGATTGIHDIDANSKGQAVFKFNKNIVSVIKLKTRNLVKGDVYLPA